jgi:hypothetical protein
MFRTASTSNGAVSSSSDFRSLSFNQLHKHARVTGGVADIVNGDIRHGFDAINVTAKPVRLRIKFMPCFFRHIHIWVTAI